MPHVKTLDTGSAVLVVIDVQEKMLAAIGTSPPETIITNITRLARVAGLLEIPVLLTEQNPAGLGTTSAVLRDALSGAAGPMIKQTCSCWRDEAFRSALQRTEREHVILCGLEGHICIQQTALDLLRVDYTPFVILDAIGSRRAMDLDATVARMRQAGVEISTTESVIFELVERCDHPRFREVLKLVK